MTRRIGPILFASCILLCFELVAAKNEYVKLFGKCSKEKDIFNCLKKRALEVIDSAIKDDRVYVINDYLTVGRDPSTPLDTSFSGRSNGNASSSGNVTEESLDEQLDRKFYEYFASRSVRLTLPGTQVEGRKKKGGDKGGYLIGGLAIAGMMAQLAYGKIAFLAGTALLTAKIALVMSSIIGLKKLLSSGGGGHEVIYATASEHHGGYGGGGGGGYGGGWQRAFDSNPPT